MKSKLLRFIVIIIVLAACAHGLKETYIWYEKTGQSDKDLANLSPRKLEQMRDSIFAKIEDLRQIIKNTSSYLQKSSDGSVYLDIRSEADEFILKMSDARIAAVLKRTRAGLNDEVLRDEVKKFSDLQISARAEIEKLHHIKKIKKLKENSIRLGLDLAGGIHIVLGVDLDKLGAKLREKYRDHWKTYMPLLANESAFKNKSEEEREAEAKRRSNNFLESRIRDEIKDAPDRARQVIQNRVDQFGVSEVSIRLGPNNTLIIQLPGANDVSAAEEILTRTGNLTMQIVDQKVMRSIPFTYKGRQAGVDDRYITDKGVIRKLKLLFKKAYEVPAETQTITLTNAVTNQPQVITIPSDANVYDVQIRDQFGLPKTVGAVILKRKILLEGDVISDAYVNYQSRGISNQPIVDFQLSASGADLFAKITRENKGQLLAILLDGKMKSAPQIREEIAGGRGQISGNFTAAEASFLAGILKAGALKVPLKIEELRVVGPSLGSKQIGDGIKASLIALLVTVLFMIYYYRLSGFIADIAMVLNLFFLMAVLTALDLTLTLPGIAGIILTIGMSVDANVIINERIKEEIKDNKSVDASIEAGYGKAFRTIFDSNITTIMAALVISQVGTGPIRGFGVTLLVGILASMFTALFVTRTILQTIVAWFKVKKLSIFPIFNKYPGRAK